MSNIHPPGELIRAGSSRLWVERHGRGDPVMLLSGLGPAGSHLVFHPHFDTLANDHEVIYVDLAGRGRSESPPSLREITFRSDVTDIAALIETLSLKPLNIYGFSYGGLIAQALALDHPTLIRTVTLANTLHSPEMWQLNHENINRELANQYPEVWDRILLLRASGLASTHPTMSAEFAIHSRLVRFFDPGKASLLLSEPGSRNAELYPLFCGSDVDFIIGSRVSEIPDFRPLLKDIVVPLLILAGRFDRALYPRLQREFLQFAPQAEFRILEKSGSFGHVEEPETVFALLRDFWHRKG